MALSASKLVAALVLLAAPETGPEPCQVIVNPANPARQIQRAALVAIYMGAMTRWSDGTPIAPVDQSTRSAVRAAFSEKLLGKSLQAMQSHWLRKMAEGHSPPPVKSSDAAVAAWVRAHAGAIGYVGNGFTLDETVRVVKVVDEGKSTPGRDPMARIQIKRDVHLDSWTEGSPSAIRSQMQSTDTGSR